MKRKDKLEGVVGTPVTPLTESGSVDIPTLEKLVDFLVGTEVDAIALPMHIGESLNLSGAERKQLAEVAVKTVAGRVPVMVNISLPGTDAVIELARHAQSAGADAVVVITPYHWRPPEEALRDHFVSVGRSVEIGLIAYNYPERLGVSVTPSLIAQLIEKLDNFIGLKDASFNMEYFTEACRISSQLRPEFSVFTGLEYMLPSFVVGGAGSFSGAGAVAPRLVRRLYDACKRRDLVEALKLQYQFSELWQVLQAGYPASIKAAMALMGRPVGKTRQPIPYLSVDGAKNLERRLNQLGLLEDEVRGWEARITAGSR